MIGAIFPFHKGKRCQSKKFRSSPFTLS